MQYSKEEIRRIIYSPDTIAQRIKDERIKMFGERGKSALAAAVIDDEKGETGVHRNTINAWESGKQVPTLRQLLNLCNVFNCQLGYLLGEHDCKTRENSDIQDVIALSDTAIDSLISMKSQKKSTIARQKIDALNLLLENEETNNDFLGLVTVSLLHEYEDYTAFTEEPYIELKVKGTHFVSLYPTSYIKKIDGVLISEKLDELRKIAKQKEVTRNGND